MWIVVAYMEFFDSTFAWRRIRICIRQLVSNFIPIYMPASVLSTCAAVYTLEITHIYCNLTMSVWVCRVAACACVCAAIFRTGWRQSIVFIKDNTFYAHIYMRTFAFKQYRWARIYSERLIIKPLSMTGVIRDFVVKLIKYYWRYVKNLLFIVIFKNLKKRPLLDSTGKMD